ALPVRMGALRMARQAQLAGVARTDRVEPTDVFLLAGVDVLLARTVARLARLTGARRGRPAVLRLAVQRVVQAPAFRFVARRARLITDQTGRLRRWRGRRSGRRRMYRWWSARQIDGGVRAGGRSSNDGHPHEHERGHQQVCRKTVTSDAPD